ncbi:hypothetical protein [Pleurocapsa sp. FMAR1]|uniref:hypothetical protein n=1 Tax=Pleurocapsa sp. FMAR1 TaxID=3040204 RepID=UPI0029C82E45|nr:hypothetical protein [Pleurocapsa sp. FMAR1]
MAEENKTSSTQADETNAKTTATKSRTETKAKTTKTDDKALALSVQPRAMLPQNRPIEPSHIEIVHTYSSVGSDRPVSKGPVEFSSTIAISGNRPIAASTLQISESYIMGNRPIASNESDDTDSLMGYLD